MDEFALISRYLAPLAGPEGLGLLDDAALYTPRSGFDLILTKDCLVEGVHFVKGHYGADTAERLLRTNLSDLAAKGARPIGYLLALAWPVQAGDHIDEPYFKAFTLGLKIVQDAYDFSLLGGDTVHISGPMVISASFIGEVPQGHMVKRSGAKVGDDIWVTGSLGNAKLGCALMLGQPIQPKPDGAAIWAYEQAYLRPEPRLLFRKILRQFASACADISDGILADAAHICRASHVTMEIAFEAIPIADAARQWALGQDSVQEALKEVISFGDDYELIFTASPDHAAKLVQGAQGIGLKLTKIGQVKAMMADDTPNDAAKHETVSKITPHRDKVAQDNSANSNWDKQDWVKCYDNKGELIRFQITGYKHF